MSTFDAEFPEAKWMLATRPDDGPMAFISWKDSDVSIQLECLVCRRSLHIDGLFAHYAKCVCGAVMQMRALIEYRLMPESAEPHVQPASDTGVS